MFWRRKARKDGAPVSVLAGKKKSEARGWDGIRQNEHRGVLGRPPRPELHGWAAKMRARSFGPRVKSVGSQDDKLKRVDGLARLKPCSDTKHPVFTFTDVSVASRAMTERLSRICAMTMYFFRNTCTSVNTYE